MKNTLLAICPSLCLDQQYTTTAGSIGDASLEQVVDTSGKKVRAGASYYILPAAIPLTRCGSYGRCRSGSEGLSLSSIDKSCPLDVVVVDGGPYGHYHGLPLTFSPVDSKKGVVRVSTDLNIMFCTDHTSCAEFSPVWKLDDFDESKGLWFVTTGGSLGNPGWQTIRNWFKIEKCGDDAYKLVYCPSVCPSSKYQLCKDIGVFVDESGNRRLALRASPMVILLGCLII